MLMARSRVSLLVVVVPLAAILGCSGVAQVATQRAPSADVSGFRTWEWATPAPVMIADQERERDAAVLDWTIRDAVGRALAAKGYQHVEGASPDFLVDFGIRLEEKSTDTFGQYITYRERGGKQDMGAAFVFGYEEGTLQVEITDARSGALAYSASARTVLDDGQDVTKLEDSVGRILAGFPAASTAPEPSDTARAPHDTEAFRAPEP